MRVSQTMFMHNVFSDIAVPKKKGKTDVFYSFFYSLYYIIVCVSDPGPQNG